MAKTLNGNGHARRVGGGYFLRFAALVGPQEGNAAKIKKVRQTSRILRLWKHKMLLQRRRTNKKGWELLPAAKSGRLTSQKPKISWYKNCRGVGWRITFFYDKSIHTWKYDIGACGKSSYLNPSNRRLLRRKSKILQKETTLQTKQSDRINRPINCLTSRKGEIPKIRNNSLGNRK